VASGGGEEPVAALAGLATWATGVLLVVASPTGDAVPGAGDPEAVLAASLGAAGAARSGAAAVPPAVLAGSEPVAAARPSGPGCVPAPGVAADVA
jgi:hypothetical protein